MESAASRVILAAIGGSELSADELTYFRENPPAGVTLFSRNAPKPQDQISRLITQIQSLRQPKEPPYIIAIDQEGGRVRRLKDPFPNHGPAQFLEDGRADARALNSIESYGLEIGTELLKLGFNVNFAPVVDILTEPSNDAIGDRVFGKDAESVIARAGVFLKGMQKSGIKGCLKHFPGQGDAGADTHKSSATIGHDRAFLENRELRPFQALLNQAPMVMMSHCIYPAYDEKPASISNVMVEQILKKQLGFTGLVVSDDMVMEALSQDMGAWENAIVESVAAGVDLVLVCKALEKCQRAVHALKKAAEKSAAFRVRLDDAALKVMKFRQTLKL